MDIETDNKILATLVTNKIFKHIKVTRCGLDKDNIFHLVLGEGYSNKLVIAQPVNKLITDHIESIYPVVLERKQYTDRLIFKSTIQTTADGVVRKPKIKAL